MKTLVCEMCNSNDLVKQDGYFVCQCCGTKYSVEEAKKMMIEGTVEVQGTVKVDNSESLKKLYQAARNARRTSNNAIALKHYEEIQAKDPNNWEALFYVAILKTESIKNVEIASAAATIANSLSLVFSLIDENINDIESKKKAVTEIFSQCRDTANELMFASKHFYKSLPKSSIALYGNALEDEKMRSFHISMIMMNCGESIETTFGLKDNDYKTMAVQSWKYVTDANATRKREHGMGFMDETSKNFLISKIKSHDSSYAPIASSNSNSGGCYVATAVYGSYDCPQVWTLRRFRDYTLAKTWYGCAFIHIYYAISPTLVKWFGKTNWFRNIWKPKLDKLVNKLNQNGVADTPYNDKVW